MNALELLYAQNTISRKRGVLLQTLTVCLVVENRGFSKIVEVRWAGEDGVWTTTAATFHSASGQNCELWQMQVTRQASADKSLPGNIVFALRALMEGREYWNNNSGANFALEADSGVCLRAGLPIANLAGEERLQADQRVLPVAVAVDCRHRPKAVFVEWSADHWRTRHRTPCFATRDHWDKTEQSNARNPNQYGIEMWSGRVKVRDIYRVEYAVVCVDAGGRELWDNNLGANYLVRRNDLKIMTLNLHCYQEEDQDAKFTIIANAIAELDVDVVCLQEVAEYWNGGAGDWASNSARIIQERIGRPYHLFTDWSHLGFDRYREGVAILSRYPILKQESRYVSANQNVYDIHARKAIMVQIDAPGMGLINVFCAHLSWWRDGFREQFNALTGWARDLAGTNTAATLLCGDFNIKAGEEGYAHVVRKSDYEDQYLRIRRKDTFDAIFRRRTEDALTRLHDDHRIDYIWLKQGGKLKAKSARVLFNEKQYGRVSDHVGYLVAFEPD